MLGWSNEGKIAALEKLTRDLRTRMQATAARYSEVQRERNAVAGRLSTLDQLSAFSSFRDLDFAPLVQQIHQLGR